MPARQGNTSINVSLPDDLVERLDVLASKPGLTRSQVVTDAVRGMLEGTASQTLLEGLHQRLDAYGTALVTQTQALDRLALGLQDVCASVTLLRQRFERWVDETPTDTAPRPGVIPFTPRGGARSTTRRTAGVTPWRWFFRYLRISVRTME